MAGRIPAEVIEEIRKDADIVDVVGQYVQLKKSGKNYSGLCPFHNEKTPSFSVSAEKQMYHCFGCGKGGNVFQFIQEIEGLNFPEAVIRVADLENIDVEIDQTSFQPTDINQSTNNKRKKLIEIHQQVAQFYHHILLNTEVGEPALAYLESRGMTQDLIEQFQIGFAPFERTLLEKYLSKEFGTELFEDSGLFIQKDDGQWLDRFYQRIMFPIRNQKGEVVAFSGRILTNEEIDTSEMPKYLNSPETSIFSKSQVLFNLDLARPTIRRENEVFLFEGFMDVIASWHAGLENGVASMGTSLTNEQIQQLRKITDRLVICYDGDQAGMDATNRALDLFESQGGFKLSIVALPEKLDPDEYIRKYGAESYQSYTQNHRLTPFNYRALYYQQGKDLSKDTDLFSYLQLMINQLAKISSAVEREVYINQLSKELGISSETIEKELRNVSFSPNNHYNEHSTFPEAAIDHGLISKQPQVLDRTEKAEQILLYRVLHDPMVRDQLQQLDQFSFVHDHYQEIYQHFIDYLQYYQSTDLAGFLTYLKSDKLRDFVSGLEYMEIAEESSSQEIEDCLKQILSYGIEEEIKQKTREQLDEKKRGNHDKVVQLTVEIIQLQAKLKKS